MSIAPLLKRVQEMAETTLPLELMKKKKPEGFEAQHIDKIDVINFETFRLHFFTSLTHYTFVVVGSRDSVVDPKVFSMIYSYLCEYCLKNPSYTVLSQSDTAQPADQLARI